MKNKIRQYTYKQVRIWDQMVLIGIGLAAIYWVLDSFMLMLDTGNFNLFQLLFGTSLDDSWTRLVVLCLFIIFGSHVQFTMNARKHAEEEHQKTEEQYHTLVNNISVGIFRATPGLNGKFLMANPAFLKIIGVESEDELRKMNVADIYEKPDEGKIILDNILPRGEVPWAEIRLKRKDGTPCWAMFTAKMAHGKDSKGFRYFDTIIEDISEYKQSAAAHEHFQKLLSPDVAEMLASGRLKTEKGGQKRVASVLFANIRGFTAMSERMKPTEVLRMLNEYYEGMVNIVFRHGGTVDKFIGDEIMVIWGAPVAHDNDPVRSVHAAIDMQSMLAQLNEDCPANRQIRIGIGINTGSLVAGYIGSTCLMSYSVIGDTVNTASRLCSAAKPGQIIISEETYNHVKSVFDIAELKPILAKGKAEPIRIFSVNNEQ
ncbi:adenylate/guanylate cyclase domain-containing protein [Desulfonema magnum]|uniref:Adenylyl/guanylyl cyclase domain-containing protein, PAS domain-containing n=1 Tax=Desulfonema magnum TaxID=45655 RepID=A0A975BUI8_9BACT|nr:adenylate/guanylate cyclase domain-containing protein [Desulfonema magnum]QTA92016.1 Adenylyl/guanylyl cyclase domain-containing protein, PAS domain-containing [Desulfonema magnum]